MEEEQQTTKGRGITARGPYLFLIVFTVMLFSMARATSDLLRKYQYADPVVATVCEVAFNHGQASATLSVPGVPTAQTIDLTDAPCKEIVAWANHQGQINVFQNGEKQWQIYQQNTTCEAFIAGLILIALSAIFSSNIGHFKWRPLRLIFTVVHLGIFWTIHLLAGTFQWFFVFHLLPIVIAGLILSRTKEQSGSSSGVYVSTFPPYSWGGRAVMVIVGMFFIGIGMALQFWVLRSGRASIEALQARHEVVLTPHLSKTYSSSGRTSKTTSEVIASYLKEDGKPHYVCLDSDEDPHLSYAKVCIHDLRFQRLYDGQSVYGSVSCGDLDSVYLCMPTLSDSVFLNDSLANFSGIHLPLLLSVPFLIFGLLMFGMFCIELLLPRRKLVYNAKRDWVAQHWCCATRWILLPAVMAIAGCQWHAFYGRLPTVPLYITLALFAPVVGTLLLLIAQRRRLRNAPIYALTYQKEATGITFTITPSQSQPPTVHVDNSPQKPIRQGENQWCLAWMSPPKYLQIHLEDGAFFHLS